jgi:hypothetical protein
MRALKLVALALTLSILAVSLPAANAQAAPKKARILSAVPGPVTGTLTVYRIVGLPGAGGPLEFGLPSSGVLPDPGIPGVTVYADVWQQDGLTYVNANVSTHDRTYFAGTPYELSWQESTGSLVFGSPLEFGSRGIVFAGQPVDVGFDSRGAWSTNVKVTRNGAQLTVNETSSTANGASSIGLHLVVPGVGEAWFNGIETAF